MKQADATLLAASIAAAAALTSLIVNLLGARRAEMRAAHRQLLGPCLHDLALDLHQILATATVLRQRALGGQDVRAWIDRGAEAAGRLKELRPRVRYQLAGIDEALRVLSRLPEWIATYRDSADGSAEVLLVQARALGTRLDRAIEKSYRRGLPPSSVAAWRVRRSASRVRSAWGNRFTAPKPAWWRLIAHWKARRNADLAAATEDAARDLSQVIEPAAVGTGGGSSTANDAEGLRS
jgi:hypothetical protein